MKNLTNIAGHSRVWIFQADRFLTESEVELITKEMSPFLQKWAAHGNTLYGDFKVENNLFLIVGADEAKSPTSGCSIDALTHKIKAIGAALKIDFFNRLAIAYENEASQVELITMQEFKQKIADNKITTDTIVFNNLINTNADLVDNWRTTVKNSWHMNLYELA
jgi:hypothetical protein